MGVKKLTWEQVQDIRSRVIERGDIVRMGAEFGVSHSMISMIRRGGVWEGVRADDDAEWRSIPGFSRYEASADGRIRRAGALYPLKQHINDRGRPTVSVADDGDRSRTVYVHRLVALAFHGLPGDGEEVCHCNGVRTDNRASNLRWDTKTENQRDVVRHGNNRNAAKTECAKGHPFDEENTILTVKNGRQRRHCRICRKANERVQVGRRKRERTEKRLLTNAGGWLPVEQWEGDVA